MERRLYGRVAEQTEIDRFLDRVRSGAGGALVVRGEPGIGKTALLDHAADTAGDVRVLRGTGTEAEAELPFASLHLLLRRHLDRIDALPARQAAALRGAFALSPARADDRFLTGLALLSLLTGLAAGRPLLCLVDDAQWLDRASAEALVFVARRLDAEAIGIVFATRPGERVLTGAGLPGLRPAALGPEDSAALLAEHPGDLAPHTRERILEEAAGNPLALIELPGMLSPEESRCEPHVPVLAIGALSAEGRVQEAYRRRVQRLPERTQDVLALLAAEGSGDLRVVLRAAGSLDRSLADLAPAETGQLIVVTGTEITFRHPLIRAAAYHGVPLSRRLAVHRAIAGALDDADDDRRAWHLSAGTTVPDEDVAAQLERAGGRALRRAAGSAEGSAAVAAFERAAELTPAPGPQARRLAAAADAAVRIGHLERADVLARRAAGFAKEPRVLEDVARVRAAVEEGRGHPQPAGRFLLEAAGHATTPEDTACALVEAARTAWTAADPELLAEVSGRLAALPPDGFGRYARWAAGMRALLAGDAAGGLPPLLAVVDAARAHGTDHPPMQLAFARTALLVGDDPAARELAERLAGQWREGAVTGLLPRALQVHAHACLNLGDHAGARSAATEALRLAADTHRAPQTGLLDAVLARLAALAGDEAACTAAVARGLSSSAADSDRIGEAWRGSVLALLDLGLGRCEAAFDRLQELVTGPAGQLCAMVASALADHVEAAVRAGRPEHGKESLDRLQEFADHCPRPWARAVALRCRALLAGDDAAEEHYAAAVRLHEEGGRPFERARTELLYGEWLRRRRRRTDSRRYLRSALELFERLDAAPWAERARTELSATGEPLTAGDRAAPALGALTPQELQVVRLAAAGRSNRDIAAQLFLSHRTVAYHLHKAFPKLAITSRLELARLDLGG